MTNQQLVEWFANTPQRDVTSNNLSIRSNALYSYETPIAIYQEEFGVFLVSLHKYSVATTRHQSLLVKYLEFAGFVFTTTLEPLPLNHKTAPDWEQNAKDAEQILCDSGDLLRECQTVLEQAGCKTMAEKVDSFCQRVHRCMTTGRKWEDTAT